MKHKLTIEEAAVDAVFTPRVDRSTRRPYAQPQITAHGTVKELTLAVDAAGEDGLGGSAIVLPP
ncbi:MAG TPA: hypothetical protein VK689_11225 [Armatimonadota bacterium]|nr:hypothetical protein [Armatimonadota bacterium]